MLILLAAINPKKFSLNLETFLNEVYVRDIGVKFKIDDDRLIIQEAAKELYNQKSRYNIIEMQPRKSMSHWREAIWLGIVIAPGTDRTLSDLAFQEAFALCEKGGASAIAI